jgi:hypothetical protein
MRIVEFPHKWLARPEMAKLLGVSERTVTRKVDAGFLVRRNTSNGNVYALASRETGHETGQDMSRVSPAPVLIEAVTRHARQDTRQDETNDVLQDILKRLEALERRNVELETLNTELTIRLESIEHAHDWHVAVDGILEKRRKKLARLTR